MTNRSYSNFPKENETYSPIGVRTLTAAGLLMVAVTYGLARYSFGLFLPEIRAEFALSSEAVGLIAGGSYLSFSGAIILSAWLSTAYGPKLPIVLAGLAATAGMGLIAIAPTELWLIFGVFVAGASPGLSYAPFSDVMVHQISPNKQNKVYAWINSGTGFGVLLTGALVLWLNVDWRTAWSLFASLAFLVTIFNAWVIPISQPSRNRRFTLISEFTFYLNKSSAYGLFTNCLIFGIVTAVYWTYSVDLLHSFLTNPQASNVFWITIGIAGALGCIAGEFVSSFGIRFAYRVTMIVVAIAIGSLPFMASTSFGTYISASLFGLGFIVATAIFGMWSMLVFKDWPSIGFGMTFFLISIGQGIGPIFAGFVQPYLGYEALFIIAGLISACLALCAHRSFPIGNPTA